MKNKLKLLLLFSLSVAIAAGTYSCKKEENVPTPTQGGEEPEAPTFDNEFDSSLYVIRDATVDAVDVDAVIDESLYSESIASVQKLEAESQQQIISFGDSLYNVYFKTSLKKSLPYDITENQEVFIEDANRNYSGKYLIKTGSCQVKLPSWGETEFNSWINTVVVLHKDKSVDVYLIPTAGYFKSGGYLFMKHASVNQGRIYNNECVHFREGDRYVYFHIKNFDEFADGDPSWSESRQYLNRLATLSMFPLSDFGYVNIFPLILSDNGHRYYTHPIHIYTSSYYDESISAGPSHSPNSHPDYGKVYGTIDGARVICNGPNNLNCGDCGFQTYQCSELCARYVTKVLGRKVTKTNANNFHTSNSSALDYWEAGSDQYIPQAPHESDVLILKTTKAGDVYGHIVVVSRVDYENHLLYYSHQNGGRGVPIMRKTTFHEKNGRYKIDWGGGFFDVIVRPKVGSQTYAADIDKEHKNEYSKDPDPQPINLRYDISSDEVFVGDDLYLNVYTDVETEVELTIGKKRISTKEYSKRTKIKLPTDTEGTFKVDIFAITNDDRAMDGNVSYSVKKKIEPEYPVPVITATLSDSKVEVGESIKLSIDTDIDCDITYTVNGSTKTYNRAVYLPTDREGNYTVTITATAIEGGKEKTVTKYYTVIKTEEQQQEVSSPATISDLPGEDL